MAAGVRCGEAAERLLGFAEQRFLAGDLAGALRAAREAQVCACRTPLPGLADALAAYEVHAAAEVSRVSGRNWYAVLSVGARTSLPSGGGAGVTYDDIKRHYHRLCLVLHPDKNRSAAADGAFKLLQEAWNTLSARHPPAPAAEAARPPRSVPTPSPARPRPTAPPASAARSGSNYTRRAPPAADSMPREAERRAGDTSNSRNNPGPPPAPPRAFRSILCGQCGRKFYAGAGGGHEEELCAPCRNPTPPAGADAEADTPPPPPLARQGSRRFPCPASCKYCGAGYSSSTVSVGMWNLHCTACHRYARVHVRSPYNAENW